MTIGQAWTRSAFRIGVLSAVMLLFVFKFAAADCNLRGGIEVSAEKRKKFRSIPRETPDWAAVQFDHAIDYATAGNSQRALALLQQALAQTPWLDPSAEKAFASLHDCSQFQELVEREHRKFSPVQSSRVIFTIPQKDLIPEGVAADPLDGTLYVGSIYHRKIVKISASGNISDFVSEAKDGLLGVLGIKVDPRDRSIWAATELRGQSELFHINRDGITIAKFRPQESGIHEFNDLVVTAKGDVLVTDDLDNAVYKLAAGSGKLLRMPLPQRTYPNGIALSADEKSVYVAHTFGIARMGLDGNGIADLRKPNDISLAQVDGLYRRGNSLIAIQNAFGGDRIVRLRLAADGNSIVSGQLLEYRSKNLDLPTTGTIFNNNFYYIVNTQIDHEKDGVLSGEAVLQPVRIAVIALN